MTLTTTQIAWLIALLEGRNPWGRIHGMSAHGGATCTEASLRRHGLLDHESQLTPAGRDRAIMDREKRMQRMAKADR